MRERQYSTKGQNCKATAANIGRRVRKVKQEADRRRQQKENGLCSQYKPRKTNDHELVDPNTLQLGTPKGNTSIRVHFGKKPVGQHLQMAEDGEQPTISEEGDVDAGVDHSRVLHRVDEK